LRIYFTVRKITKRAWMHDLSEIVKTRRLRRAGHVLKMPESRPASVAQNWLPETGRRTRVDHRRHDD